MSCAVLLVSWSSTLYFCLSGLPTQWGFVPGRSNEVWEVIFNSGFLSGLWMMRLMYEIQWNGREISFTTRIVGPRSYGSVLLLIFTIIRVELWTSLLGVVRTCGNPAGAQAHKICLYSRQGFEEIVCCSSYGFAHSFLKVQQRGLLKATSPITDDAW